MEENERLLSSLGTVTIGSCIIIIVAAIVFAAYIISQKKKHQLNIHRQWIEQMPTIVSTLGVLGTFVGITIGLYYFDPNDLDSSIPLLLSGLKTAFITSLAGMAGSLVLTRIINRCFDEVDSKELEQDKMLRLLTALTAIQNYLSGDDIKRFRNGLATTCENMYSKSEETNELLKNIAGDLQQIKDDIEEIKGQYDEIRQRIGGETADTLQIKRLIGVVTTATESIARMDENIEGIRDMSKSISENVAGYADELEEIRDSLSGD